VKPFFLALQFLTRLPTPALAGISPQDWGRAVLFFPVVGLLIGGVLTGLQTLLSVSDPLLQAALLTVIWVALTGGLHLDGLADCADAWVGGHGDREKTLAIMKDPASGPIGVAAVVLALLLKFAAIAALAKTSSLAALFLAPLLGRAALPALLLAAPYARPGGLGEAMAQALPRRSAMLLLAVILAAVLAAGGWKAALAAMVVFGLVYRAARKRLGGVTGDVLGAAVELTETAVLAALAFQA
jgi:adenosylcobinamide-GDP ribazoletransferase